MLAKQISVQQTLGAINAFLQRMASPQPLILLAHKHAAC